ncbi:MAG: ParA family protein [Propionibacteriaceae bacterium]
MGKKDKKKSKRTKKEKKGVKENSLPSPRRALYDVPDEGLPPVVESDSSDVSRETCSLIDPLPRPDKTRIMAVVNQKGGVGKTTTTVNVATALAMGGLRVLVLDIDPQGNASTALGIEHSAGTPSVYEVLLEGGKIADNLHVSDEAPNLLVVPATIDLAGSEIQLVNLVARETRIKKALAAYLAENPTDYVLFDCPPSLGLLTLNALVAADEILVPIQCEYYALEGVSAILNTIELVKAELNEALEVSTVVLTMYDGRTKLSAEVAAEVRQAFPYQTLKTAVPRSVRVSEAPSYGQTVLTYNAASPGARAYLDIASEIAVRGAKEKS